MLRPLTLILAAALAVFAVAGMRRDGAGGADAAGLERVPKITAASAPSAPSLVMFRLPDAGPGATDLAEAGGEAQGRGRGDASDSRLDGAGRLQFPARDEWEDFSRRLTRALAAGSLHDFASLEAEAESALAALRAIPGHVEYADWLEDRLADIEVARLAAEWDQTVLADGASVPLYDVWLEWMQHRPPPRQAEAFVRRLKPIFISAQLPPALVWLAETESSFNPSARSPAGALGLFQLMPGTARDLGLRVHPHDDRLDPVRSAESAARYLAKLQRHFGDWPLVLAAYNAGPSRVSRLLESRGASSFAEIADGLPVETQLYVPRVLATLTIREGLTPGALAFTQSALAAE